MLSDREGAIVARWLRDAMARRRVTMTALAEACGVRPQAVYGWLKTGRITKRNLALATAFLGAPSPFAAPDTATALPAQEPAATYGWPFTLIDQGALQRAPRADLDRIEAAIIALAHTLGLDIVRRPPPRNT